MKRRIWRLQGLLPEQSEEVLRSAGYGDCRDCSPSGPKRRVWQTRPTLPPWPAETVSQLNLRHNLKVTRSGQAKRIIFVLRRRRWCEATEVEIVGSLPEQSEEVVRSAGYGDCRDCSPSGPKRRVWQTRPTLPPASLQETLS